MSLLLSLRPHRPSAFVKLPRVVPEGQFESARQPIEVPSPPAKQSFAADFDQVSSFGRRARFPDNIACCGNRNSKVSGDTRVALSVHTLHFYVWPSQTLFFLRLVLWDLTLKNILTFIVGTFIWWCWNRWYLIIQIKNMQLKLSVFNMISHIQLDLTGCCDVTTLIYWFRFDLISWSDLLVWSCSSLRITSLTAAHHSDQQAVVRYQSLLSWIKGSWHGGVTAAPLCQRHLVLILSAYSTCRFAERLFLFLFSLFIFFFLCVFDRIPVQRMSPSPHTLRPCGHKGNSYRATVFPQVAARAVRNQGPVSVCGWSTQSCCMLSSQCVNCSEVLISASVWPLKEWSSVLVCS